MNVAPEIVSVVADNPENPESVAPAFRVRVPEVLRVPVPDSVPPVRVMLPPLFAEGSAPRGKLHVVTVLIPAVWVKVTTLKVFTVQASVAAVVPLMSTVPPFATNVGEPEIVSAAPRCMIPDGAVNAPLEMANAPATDMFPAVPVNVPPDIVKVVARVMVPDGAVKVPLKSVNAPLVVRVVKAPAFRVPPDTVRIDAARPEKPERLPPALKVNAPDVVSVPEPERVPPVRVMLPPLLALGFAPSGKLHVVTVLMPAAWVNVTALNVFTVQASVAAVTPLKSTVPPLAVNVGAPEIVNAPPTCRIPEVAVYAPLDRAKAPATDVVPVPPTYVPPDMVKVVASVMPPEGAVKVPLERLKAPLVVNGE